jgi:hypothetical protein
MANLRRGGVVAFLESEDLTRPVRTHPATPLHEQLARWFAAPPDGTGPIVDMGLRLSRTFIDAGLPAPQLSLDAPIGAGDGWPGYAYVAESVRSLLPVLTQVRNIDAGELDLETLADRLRDEAVARRAVQVLPTVIGAWSRRD